MTKRDEVVASRSEASRTAAGPQHETAGAASHTPGPWYADDGGRIREEASDYILARIDDGGHIGGKRMISEEAERANARLIAVAPMLLEALEDADSVLLMADRSQAWREERDRCRARIAAALTAAKGE